MTAPARYSVGAMTAAMREVAAGLGLSREVVDAAELLQLTNNATFALPAAGLVIRVTRSRRLHERAHKIVRLGRWFAQTNAPTIQLADVGPQPLATGEGMATIWQYVPPTTEPVDVTDLGAVLRQFHQLHPTDSDLAWLDLPGWDPIGDARKRLTDADALDDETRSLLLAWCDHLEPLAEGARERNHAQLVHGDAHTGNLLRTPHGRVVLSDFDPTALGPWQVDLTPGVIDDLRFGRHGSHQMLVDSYGADVTDDADWPIFRQARELKLVIAAAPLLGSSGPRIDDQFRLRLRSILDEHDTATWTPYADLLS